MLNQVFPIHGNKIFSFVADTDSLKFSGSRFNTVEEFLTAFGKKLSLTNKIEIKYDSIKSVRKEDNAKTVKISYKTFAGITGSCEFSFNKEEDCELFFNYLEKERYFQRTIETLTPFKAIRSHILGLVLTIAVTAFAYYQATGIANGTVEISGYGKARAFDALLGFLGNKGVLAVGGAITAYILYKIWLRYSNPPNQTRLIAPNGY